MWQIALLLENDEEPTFDPAYRRALVPDSEVTTQKIVGTFHPSVEWKGVVSYCIIAPSGHWWFPSVRRLPYNAQPGDIFEIIHYFLYADYKNAIHRQGNSQ